MLRNWNGRNHGIQPPSGGQHPHRLNGEARISCGPAHCRTLVEAGHPFFFGGFAGFAYLITGEHRGFNRAGGFQTRLTPDSPLSLHHAGPGAWEVAGRYSYVDLTDGPVDGGVMSRWTGALSWYANREWRFEFNYGYITLDKAAERGHAHGISSRIVWNM